MLFDHRDMVEEFQGEYRFLSNFYPSEFQYTFTDYGYHGGGVETFKSVEHFYQAMKVMHDADLFRQIIECESPGKAKRLSRKFDMTKHPMDWDSIKVPIMRIGIQAKFNTIPELRKRLLDTVDMYLQEGNNWGDDFWGFDFKTQKGKNVLGTLLMEERKRIINTQTNDQ